MNHYNEIFEKYTEFNFNNEWLSQKEIIDIMQKIIPNISNKQVSEYIVRIVTEDGEGENITNEILEPSNKMLTDFFNDMKNKETCNSDIHKIIHFCLTYRSHPSCLDEDKVYLATGVSLKEVLESIEAEEYELKKLIKMNIDNMEMINQANQKMIKEELIRKNKIYEEYIKHFNECIKLINEIMPPENHKDKKIENPEKKFKM